AHPALVAPRQSTVGSHARRSRQVSWLTLRRFLGRCTPRRRRSLSQVRDPRLPPRPRQNPLPHQPWRPRVVPHAHPLRLVPQLTERPSAVLLMSSCFRSGRPTSRLFLSRG